MSPTPPRSRPPEGSGSAPSRDAAGGTAREPVRDERDPGTAARRPGVPGRPGTPATPVAVFQAPRATPPRARPADVESPFLELFGASPEPAREATGVARPLVATPPLRSPVPPSHAGPNGVQPPRRRDDPGRRVTGSAPVRQKAPRRKDGREQTSRDPGGRGGTGRDTAHREDGIARDRVRDGSAPDRQRVADTPAGRAPAVRTGSDRTPGGDHAPAQGKLPRTPADGTARTPADGTARTPADRGTGASAARVEPAASGRDPAGRPAAADPRRQAAVHPGRGSAAGRPAGGTTISRRPGTPAKPSKPAKPVKPPRTAERPKATQPAARPQKPVRPDPPRYRDRDPAVDLAISEIAGHLTFTPHTVTAWYWLPEVRWAFRPDGEREALLAAIAEQYAGLSGFRLHLRRTTKPFAADEWARVVDGNTRHPLPSVAGAPSWSDHLEAAQRHLLSSNHAEGQTYLGVTFARRSLGDNLTERIGRLFRRGVAGSERRRLARMVEQFDEVLGAYGMRGRRVNVAELEWLMYRSVALCMRPPQMLPPLAGGRWERGDLLALTEQIERYRTPYGSTVKLVNRMSGEEGHVAVLTVGRMEPLEIPERHEPWLHFHERLPWPMEISSRVDVLGPGDSFRNLEHRLRMIRSQQTDYAEHGMDAPPELERLAQRALHIGDEMTTGLPTDASRVHGWHRIAVGGRTRDECLERARRLIQMYSRELRVSLQHPKNQDWLAREFIPGEPVANTGYLRRMPVKLFAAALPQATSAVGDRRGDLIGRTAGTSRRPVFLDLHFPMEVRERSGLAVFVAEPGGGKSTLLGALGYLAARRGVQVTLLDPSGPLARLAQMPELKPYSRVVNLTGSEHGTLAPYALIPTPRRSEFPDGPIGDREYEIALSNARAERRMLVQDICSMLVPPQVAREASTATLLRHAVRQVPAEESATLDDIVSTLSEMDDDEGRELANLLMDTAEMPLALLFFGSPPTGLLGSDSVLTVITMAGLRLPDLKIEREYWSAEEALALPMLHTAHRLAVRRCYGGEMNARKLVGLDEAHFMEGWRSGRSFLVRLARDSRKWNLAALVSSQNPKDILGLDVQNLVSTVFVGRVAEDPDVAAEALRLLRVPTGVGYETTLAGLSQADTSSSSRLGFREFVMRDVDGRVQKVRIDVSYVPDLLIHLDTTPAAAGPPPVIASADKSEA